MERTSFRRTRLATIPHARWAAYGAAGAASALGYAAPAEADVIYSGPVDHHFDGRSSLGFQLNRPGVSIFASHRSSTFGGGFAAFLVFAASGAVAGYYVEVPGTFLHYVSKLALGQSVKTRSFIPRGGILVNGYGAEGGPPLDTPWSVRGIGFLGFRFNGGSGLQYGWARINMDGARAGNSFTLIDYAFADPGERITAGQTSSATVPESGGSLGLLALGCAGLLAWRAARERKSNL